VILLWGNPAASSALEGEGEKVGSELRASESTRSRGPPLKKSKGKGIYHRGERIPDGSTSGVQNCSVWAHQKLQVRKKGGSREDN